MTVTETLYISSLNRTDTENDGINNFTINLNKTYRNVKSVKLKKITVMNSWYNVDMQTNKIVFYFGGAVDETMTFEIPVGFYSVPHLADAICDSANETLSVSHPSLTMSHDLDFLINKSKIYFILNDETVPFTLLLGSTTINKPLLGFFENQPDPTSHAGNGFQYLISYGIANVYVDDFIFMKIEELQDTVFVANSVKRYTFAFQNATDKLDNLAVFDEQITKPISHEFNRLTISLYNEKNELITLRNNYSFLLEIEYCNR